MRRTRVLVGGLVSLVLMTTMPAGVQAAPKKDRVTGSGHGLIFPPGAIDFFLRVNAQSGPLGEEPKGHFSLRSDPEFGEVSEIRVSVTCLRVVGNFAAVGGVITRSRPPSAAVGEGLVIALRDGSDLDAPDIFVFDALPPSATECPDAEEVLSSFSLDVEDGDFQVRDVEP